MAVKIGSKYLENLARLKHIATSFDACAPQKDSGADIDSGQGTCYYHKCPAKTLPTDSVIRIWHENGRTENYFFHSVCIEDLLADRNIPLPN